MEILNSPAALWILWALGGVFCALGILRLLEMALDAAERDHQRRLSELRKENARLSARWISRRFGAGHRN